MLLVWALVLAQWGLTLLPLRLQSTRTATSFPLWPAVLALHLQLNNPQPWRDADWLAALIPVLISAVAEVLFRKAYADRLAALQAAPAPPREAPSVSYRYKMVSLYTPSAWCSSTRPAAAVTLRHSRRSNATSKAAFSTSQTLSSCCCCCCCWGPHPCVCTT